MDDTLKIAIGQYVDQYGATQNALITWKGLELTYGEYGMVKFAVYENEAESVRGNAKNFLMMPVSSQQIYSMFSRTGNVAVEISNASWEMAMTTKFIPSRVEYGDNLTDMPRHSLADLNFQIVEIPLPEQLAEAISSRKTGNQ